MKHFKKSSLLLCILVLLALSLTGLICPDTGTKSPLFYEKANVQSQAIRSFLANLLYPLPGAKAANAAGFKATVLEGIDVLWLIINQTDALKAARVGLGEQVLLDLEQKAAPAVGFSPAQLKGYLETQPDAYFADMQSDLDKGIATIKFDNSAAIKSLTEINTPEVGPTWSKFFKGILTGYFDGVALADKKRIMAYFLRHTTPNASDAEVALSFVYGAGPFFQKYIQLVGEHIEPNGNPALETLKRGLSDVKSGLASIDRYDLRQYEEQLQNAGARVHFGRSLGAASVGETFLAVQEQSTGTREIVLKVMRPGIEEVALRESVFFEKLAASISPAMLESFLSIKQQILDEMDYRKELDKLRLGYQVYNHAQPNLRSVASLDDFPQGKHWLAMELAKGYTLKDIRHEKVESSASWQTQHRFMLFAKGKLLDQLASTLMRGAFLRSPKGFFHGDLHDGNILIYVAPEAWQQLSLETHNQPERVTSALVDDYLNRKDKTGHNWVEMTLVDFGNAHEISKEEREGLVNVLFSAGQVVQSARGFLIGFNQLTPHPMPIQSKQGQMLQDELRTEAFQVAEKPNRLVQHRLGDAIEILMQNDIPVPDALLAFFRTGVMLDDSFQELRKDATKIGLDFEGYSLEKQTVLALMCPLTYPLLKFVPYLNMSCTSADIALSPVNINAMTYGILGSYEVK